MTRRLVLMNLSNHENEDFLVKTFCIERTWTNSDGEEVTSGYENFVTLSPGEKYEFSSQPFEKLTISVEPEISKAPDKYKEATIEVVLPTYGGVNLPIPVRTSFTGSSTSATFDQITGTETSSYEYRYRVVQ